MWLRVEDERKERERRNLARDGEFDGHDGICGEFEDAVDLDRHDIERSLGKKGSRFRGLIVDKGTDFHECGRVCDFIHSDVSVSLLASSIEYRVSSVECRVSSVECRR